MNNQPKTTKNEEIFVKNDKKNENKSSVFISLPIEFNNVDPDAINKKQEYCNLITQECGLTYTKEDSNKKIIVKEPIVQYIIKDKKLNKKFRGYSCCLTEDIFDEQKGIEIARLKAEVKQREYKLNQHKGINSKDNKDNETKSEETKEVVNKPKKFAISDVISFTVTDKNTNQVVFEVKNNKK
jgi:hypothetical protein